MSQEDDIKELTNQLNLLRLQRNQIAKKEERVYEKLRQLVFEPSAATAVKTEEGETHVKSEEFESDSDEDDGWYGKPKPKFIEIKRETKLEHGDTVYIQNDNKITHFEEKSGISKYHRYGIFEKRVETKKGDKVYFRTLTGKTLWRLTKNLYKVTNPNYNE